jgi:hypothetical protein
MRNRWWQIGIFNPYGNFNAKRQGKIDGKLAIPPWSCEQQPDFLRGLYHLTQTTMTSLVEMWHKRDRSLKGAWVDATLQQQQAGKELAEATARENEAQQRHEEVHGRRLAVPESRGRVLAYWLVVAVVLICEFPLNSVVFQQLGVSALETWMMTGAIAVSMVACAHFLGAQLHQPVQGRPLVVINRILLASLPFLAIVFVAMLRRDHMRQQALSNLDSSQLLGTNLTINLLIFWALTYYSFKLHDPVVEAVLKAMARRRFWAQRLHLAGKVTASTRIDRQKQHQQTLQDATGWESEVRRRAALYRMHHIRVRPDRDQNGSPVPEWFNLEPALAIPEDLKHLEWNATSNPDEVDQSSPTIEFSPATTR